MDGFIQFLHPENIGVNTRMEILCQLELPRYWAGKISNLVYISLRISGQ